MPKVQGVTIGAPVWLDLSTSDLDKATAFYTGLFGWNVLNTGPDFGSYHIASKGEAGVGGIMQKTEDEKASGVPDAWMMYFAVEDAKATAEAIRNAGGQILFDPMDVGGLGVMAIAVDPGGAGFGLWQPGQHTGFDVLAEAGAPCWFELLTRDFAASTAFYAKVFGVELVDMQFGDEGGSYKTLNIDGGERAGIMDATNVLGEEDPPAWFLYLGVNDADEAAAKVTELGGTVLAPVAETPHGRFAPVSDPNGGVFGIIGVGDA